MLLDNETMIGKHRNSKDYVTSDLSNNKVNTEHINSNRYGIVSESTPSVHSLMQNQVYQTSTVLSNTKSINSPAQL